MGDNKKAMVLASFAADSLALGAHWIYDTSAIKRSFGRVDSFLKPTSNSFHPTKGRGDFTHYGDQAFVLLESLAARGGFDLHDFSERWRALFETYQGYIDHATRVTLSRYAAEQGVEEAGSPSDDLAGASRIASLVYFHRNDLPGLVKAAAAQTMMTHNDPATIKSAEFFARVAWQVLEGASPVDAMKTVSQESYEDSPLYNWVQVGIASKAMDSVEVISRFGQTCHTMEAFPGVVHLIARHEQDLKEALVASVMAGGDSAARGMMVGMVLGAHLGMDALPPAWLSELNKGEQILALLEKGS